AKVRRLLSQRELALENQWLRRELNRDAAPDELIGDSAAMRQVMNMVRKVAPTRSTVLLVGESGTGKELVARAIHSLGVGRGPRPEGRDGEAAAEPAGGGAAACRFLAVNCAAIPHDLLENQLFGHRKGSFTGADRDQPGVFVHAGAGTVFLDEI